MTKLLLSSLLLASVASATELTNTETATSGIVPSTSNTRDSGWYAGASMGIMNWGGSAKITKGYQEKTYNVDTEDKSMMLKLGHVSKNENRVELYYKNDTIDITEEGKLYDTSTFGINYQWGLSSLSTNTILPYIRVGIGFGSAEMDKVTVDLDAVEVDLGLGMYYEVTSQIDLSAGIYRRSIIVSSDSDNKETKLITATNGIEIGGTYHF